MIYSLPKTVSIDGVDYPIRTDFRVILEIIEMLNDEDLNDADKAEGVITMFYVKRPANIKAAIAECFAFMDMGKTEKKKKSTRLIDWEKDFQYIISPVNRVLGYEARACEYLHWWTFLAAYMEIGGDCLLSQIINIRDKQSRGIKLEKHEREWARRNAEIIRLPQKFTKREDAFLSEWIGGGK